MPKRSEPKVRQPPSRDDATVVRLKSLEVRLNNLSVGLWQVYQEVVELTNSLVVTRAKQTGDDEIPF